MPIERLVEHQPIWIEALNRGDVSAADDSFSANCVIHITGVAAPLRELSPWKELVGDCSRPSPISDSASKSRSSGETAWRSGGPPSAPTGPLGAAPATGKAVAIDGLIVDHLEDGKVRERWEQWDRSIMLQQLGFA